MCNLYNKGHLIQAFFVAGADDDAPVAGHEEATVGSDTDQRPQLGGHLPQQHQSGLIQTRTGQSRLEILNDISFIWILIQDRRHSDSSKYAARVRAEQAAAVAAGSAKGPVVVRSRKGAGGGGGAGGVGGKSGKSGSGGDISGSQRLSLGSHRCEKQTLQETAFIICP